VWRADNYDAPGATGEALDTAWWSRDLAHQLSVGDNSATPVNEAAQAWDGWWNEIADLGGVSPLIHFQDRSDNRIDISRGHPGGVARFLAGSPTLLSNLIRDDVARRPATRAALRLVDHALELSQTRGLDTIALGIGLVEWKHDGVDYCGPLLLRPVRLRRRGGDIELTLKRENVHLNHGIQRAFAQQLQVTLDSASFVALTDDAGAFKPNPALDRLRDLTAHRGDVAVSARLVISSFGEVAEPMLDDAQNLHHPIVDALGGNAHAIAQLRSARVPVEITPADSRSADADRHLVDASGEHDAIVANIVAGNSVAIRSLPGTGSTQVVVNALGALINAHKRVLVVGSRPASSRALTDRLRSIGLQGAVSHVSNPGPDLIASIGRNEKVKKPSTQDVDSAWERLRKVILRYRSALSQKDPELGVSASECFTKLGTLSLLPEPPETVARLDNEALRALAPGRGQAAELLAQAAKLGEFRYGPGDTPWYGVSFADVEDARKSHGRAQRLFADLLPRLQTKIDPILAQTPLPVAITVGQTGVFLRLLVDIRDTLDRFQPSVFDRSVKDMIVATGAGGKESDMPRMQRRRLKGLAKEHVRPGVHVGDLHESLVKIDGQRELWNRYVETGHRPSVPGGLSDAHVLFQQVEDDLAHLDRVLQRQGPGERLADMLTHDLVTLLEKLSAESDVLHSLEQRQEVSDHLATWHLQPLVEDLATRHVEADAVATELELAWWRGALESILEREEALLGSDKALLERLEADFRLVDEAHVAGNAQALSWQLAERWSLGLLDWPEEATALKTLLKTASATAKNLAALAPHLTKALAPVWLATPYNVHQIPETVAFDVVIVLDASAVRASEVLGALRRAPQVVVLGDPVTHTPQPFHLALRHKDSSTTTDRDAWHQESLFGALRMLLPTYSLETSYRTGGDDLAGLVNRAFFDNTVASMPWAGSFLGHSSLVVDILEDGHAMPEASTGLVEGVSSEVRRVVDHVLDHAHTRSGESLMVITASALHAARVYEALAEAILKRPDVAEFFAKDSGEPFLVATLDQAVALTRDRVLFSLGYGRTPHGRVLSDLGPLSEPGGERLLAVAFTRARRHLRFVSCVTPEDLRDTRLSPTTRALGDVLNQLAPSALAAHSSGEKDPLLVDLAKRLEAQGMRVELDYQGQIPLAASFGGYCIALDTDASVMGMPVREALRLRPTAFAASGWHYVRAHSLELFSTPDAVAKRIATLVGITGAPTSDDV